MADADLSEGVLEAYEGFAARLAPFAAAAGERDDVECKKGCSSCCVSGLSVGAAEAARIRRALEGLSKAERATLRRAAAAESEHCAFLVGDACAIYDARPMVCRTQGLPLAYSGGMIPAERLSAKAKDGRDLTWCPLNYTESAPRSEEIVDAEAIDKGVATLNIAYESASGEEGRVPLGALARS